jgi:hypothetical protein
VRHDAKDALRHRYALADEAGACVIGIDHLAIADVEADVMALPEDVAGTEVCEGRWAKETSVAVAGKARGFLSPEACRVPAEVVASGFSSTRDVATARASDGDRERGVFDASVVWMFRLEGAEQRFGTCVVASGERFERGAEIRRCAAYVGSRSGRWLGRRVGRRWLGRCRSARYGQLVMPWSDDRRSDRRWKRRRARRKLRAP